MSFNFPFLSGVDDGTLVHIRLAPRASQNRIVGLYGNRLKISVAAPPVDGKANRLLVTFFSKVVGCPKSSMEIRKGHSSRDKLLFIRGVMLGEVEKVLEKVLGDDY